MKLFVSGIPLNDLLCHFGSIKAALGQPGQQVSCPITSVKFFTIHALAGKDCHHVAGHISLTLRRLQLAAGKVCLLQTN